MKGHVKSVIITKMNLSKKQSIKLASLFILTAVVAILPFFYVIHSAGNHWQGVVPPYITDTHLYLTRMVKGTDSFLFGNNPFFIEHITDINPTPSAADYIAAVPLKMGLSLVNTLIFNSIFWNIIFVYLLYLFLRQLGIKKNWPFVLLLPIYLSVYGTMVRPVVLEVVLPFLLFFFLIFVGWLKQPTKSNNILLALSLATTVYIYPYTGQIALATFGLSFLWFLKKHDWPKVSLLIKISLGALLLLLPFIFYMYQEVSNPLFLDVITRSGSIKTHLPSIESFNVGRWIVTATLLWFLTFYTRPELKGDKEFKFAFSFLSLVGLGLFLVLFSPILTGRDAAIGDHVNREVFFWLSISLVSIVYFIFERTDLWKQKSYKTFLILLLVVINVIPLVKQIRRSLLQPFHVSKAETIRIQDFAKPILWLDQYDSQPGVVWADSEMSLYVPILSRHYVLTPGDFLVHQYFVTGPEIQERYLVSRYFQEVDAELLKTEYSLPLGTYKFQIKDLKLKDRVCGLIHFNVFQFCDNVAIVKATTQINKSVEDLMIKNKEEIRPHLAEFIKKYHVAYVIKDLLNDPNFNVETLKNTKEIYNDGAFAVYRLADR